MVKKSIITLCIAVLFAFLINCSANSPEKTRYDMEKILYKAQKISERIQIQPELTTAQDSLELKQVYQQALDYYLAHIDDPDLTRIPEIVNDMNLMAVSAQSQLIKYYAGHSETDSTIAGYRRLIDGTIPASPEDRMGATFSLALFYRSMMMFDSTYAIYDRLLESYYPPVDSLQHVNSDVIALPVDKINIALATGDSATANRYIDQALAYYTQLKADYPHNPVSQTATVFLGRVYSMDQQWDKAIAELEQLKDSTGNIVINAQILIANIYNDPKNNKNKAIELYRDVINRTDDSTIIGSVLLREGVALCALGRYDEGREKLSELKDKFAPYPNLMAQAQLFYARTFEAQDRWDRALSEYQWLMDNYPYTGEAFQTMAYIPEHFKHEGDQKLADIWYERAVEFYLRAANNQKDRPIEVAAYKYLADIYRKLEKWPEAINTLETIYEKSPRSRSGAAALFNAARVSYLHLGDSLQAEKYLETLRTEFGTTDTSKIADDSPTPIDSDIESLE